MSPYEVYFHSSGGVESKCVAQGRRTQPGQRNPRLHARRNAVARAHDRRRDGRRCGNVDDLAIEGGAGEVPEVVTLLVGPATGGRAPAMSSSPK